MQFCEPPKCGTCLSDMGLIYEAIDGPVRWGCTWCEDPRTIELRARAMGAPAGVPREPMPTGSPDHPDHVWACRCSKCEASWENLRAILRKEARSATANPPGWTPSDATAYSVSFIAEPALNTPPLRIAIVRCPVDGPRTVEDVPSPEPLPERHAKVIAAIRRYIRGMCVERHNPHALGARICVEPMPGDGVPSTPAKPSAPAIDRAPGISFAEAIALASNAVDVALTSLARSSHGTFDEARAEAKRHVRTWCIERATLRPDAGSEPTREEREAAAECAYGDVADWARWDVKRWVETGVDTDGLLGRTTALAQLLAARRVANIMRGDPGGYWTGVDDAIRYAIDRVHAWSVEYGQYEHGEAGASALRQACDDLRAQLTNPSALCKAIAQSRTAVAKVTPP